MMILEDTELVCLPLFWTLQPRLASNLRSSGSLSQSCKGSVCPSPPSHLPGLIVCFSFSTLVRKVSMVTNSLLYLLETNFCLIEFILTKHEFKLRNHALINKSMILLFVYPLGFYEMFFQKKIFCLEISWEFPLLTTAHRFLFIDC